MKPKPLTREQQIFEWKVQGKGIPWARWCALNGYKVHQKCPARSLQAPPARFDAQKP